MRSRVLFVVFLLFSFGFRTLPAAPEGAPATWQGEIDGVPVWITVVPRGHEISARAQAQEPWWNWGNTTTDAYLFAVESPDSVQLILDFRPQPDGLPEAWFYVNHLGWEPLDYSLQGETLTVHTNRGYPYLTVRPDGGGWFIDDKVNYDLDLSIDGFMRGFGPDQAETDGQIDITIGVGSTEPGVPNWQTLRLLQDPEPTWSYPRFVIRQRMPDAPPFKVATPLMPNFPYFGMGAVEINWLEKNPNPLYFNLKNWELQLFPFPGFHIGGIYEVNSLALPPEADFESPFVFYNFDPTTRAAQLVVRAHSFPTYDGFGFEPKAIQRSTFRYSWKTFDGGRWSYSLSFAGSHAYSQQLNIGNETIQGIPGARLPGWVTSREWPITTFVEAVEGYPGAEGIYFYSAQSNTSWGWLGGLSETPPDFLAEPFLPETDTLTDLSAESLPVGFRGEYSGSYLYAPKVYLSPIDHRVHLLHAQGGVWNLGEGRVLRTHNLNKDAYVDGWTREQLPAQLEESEKGLLASNAPQIPRALPGAIEEALYTMDGVLIYSGPLGATLRQVNYEPSRFELSPPTNQETWQFFRARLTPYVEQTRDPNDLKSWLSPFAGKTFTVAGGQVSTVRSLPNGFRFILDLQPGYRVQDANLLDVHELEPGRYVVTYDGQFAIEPLTPPAISFSLTELTLHRLQINTIRVALRNDGLEDVSEATLQLRATSPDGTTSIVATQPVQLLSGESITSTLLWAPPSSGTWFLTPQIQQSDGRLSLGEATSITVAPDRPANARNLLLISNSVDVLPMVLAGLMMFAITAALVVWHAWRGGRDER